MKKYIKLNNNDKHLSYGNFSRLIKENSHKKNSALQTEIFCLIFEIENINDTTVNNYCIGIRSIHNNYKNTFHKYYKIFPKNKRILINIINNIYYVLTNENLLDHEINKQEKIFNENKIIQKICNELFILSKNDTTVDLKFNNKLNYYIKEKNYFELFSEILFFVVLEKKQPVDESSINKNILDNLLFNTTIPSCDLESFLKLKFTDGINYDFKLNTLANQNNAYACFELGMNEFKGYKTGIPRYDKALNYFLKASEYNHPAACYMVANIYINILKSSKKDLETGYSFIEKAIEAGNIAALNTKGIMYLNGIHPLETNEKKAISCFKECIKYDYAFAYNNLGLIEEKRKNLKAAYKNYLQSANLGESWAANKIGNYYLKKNNYNEAYKYFNIGISTDLSSLCSWNYFNIAKFFYLKGMPNINIEKDLVVALEYFTIAANTGNIEALIKILELNIGMYLETRNKQIKQEIKNIIFKIETNKKYNKKVKEKIENKLKSLFDKPDLNITI